MKIPSIIRIPRYERFSYEPRFYDPIKEDIDNRRQRVKRIIAADKKSGARSSRARLEGAFTKHAPKKESEGFLRLIIGTILFAGVVGFLYFGNVAVYITIGVVLTYVVSKKLFTK